MARGTSTGDQREVFHRDRLRLINRSSDPTSAPETNTSEIYIKNGQLYKINGQGQALPVSGIEATVSGLKVFGNLPLQHSDRHLSQVKVETDGAVQTNCGVVVLKDDTSYNFLVRLVVRRSDGGGEDRASWQLRATVFRAAAGSATLQGAVEEEYKEASNASLDATLDVSGNELRVRVTGIGSQDFKWTAYIDYLESA